jgi:hypothetical protein
MSLFLNATVIDLTEKAAEGNLPGADIADPEQGFGNLIGTLFGGVMTTAAMLTFLYLLWGAVEWITSGGESGKIESARNKITQAMVGLIILAATTALFMLLQQFLDICVLNFNGSCSNYKLY